MFSCESFTFGVVESLKAGTAGGFGVGCDCKGHAVIIFCPGGRIGAESRPLLTMLLRAWREKDAPCPLFHGQVESRFTNSALGQPVTRWLATSPALFPMTSETMA